MYGCGWASNGRGGVSGCEGRIWWAWRLSWAKLRGETLWGETWLSLARTVLMVGVGGPV